MAAHRHLRFDLVTKALSARSSLFLCLLIIIVIMYGWACLTHWHFWEYTHQTFSCRHTFWLFTFHSWISEKYWTQRHVFNQAWKKIRKPVLWMLHTCLQFISIYFSACRSRNSTLSVHTYLRLHLHCATQKQTVQFAQENWNIYQLRLKWIPESTENTQHICVKKEQGKGQILHGFLNNLGRKILNETCAMFWVQSSLRESSNPTVHQSQKLQSVTPFFITNDDSSKWFEAASKPFFAWFNSKLAI